ncbi:hypothetical protein [Pedobacter aquatilis]|uniref:hypothetical protein n=1 Tax=Pedobacter aquatilis TaxID=351343 RepID=UPI00292D083A|nr:hypothetical protein [Pedobacter aquatilis]
MENILLSVQYYQLKEKALLQRHYIDYTRAEHEKVLKEDESPTGKAHLEAYKKETVNAEEDFKETLSLLQPVFEKLYTHLEKLNASRENPYQVLTKDLSLQFYIDSNKNIHYLKMK